MVSYALIGTGGKQYRVSKGSRLRVERLSQEAGDDIVLDQVFAVKSDQGLEVGEPLVSGWVVKARIVTHALGDKVTMIKMKRRKHHMRKKGHRQPYTLLEVLDIAQA